MDNIKKSFIASMIIGVITLIIATWFVMNNPGEVPVHWNIAGEVDGYGTPAMLFIFPVMILLVTPLLYFIPNLDPKGENIKNSGPILQITMILIALLMLGIEIFTISAIKGADALNIIAFVLALIGLIFISLGFYLPTLKSNYMVGIRTPWTLYSETVWKKTHEVAKYWFISVGIVFFISLLFKTPWNLILSLTYCLIIVFGIVVYSYLLFAKENKIS